MFTSNTCGHIICYSDISNFWDNIWFLYSKSMNAGCLTICMRPWLSCNTSNSNFDCYVYLNTGGWDAKKHPSIIFK